MIGNVDATVLSQIADELSKDPLTRVMQPIGTDILTVETTPQHAGELMQQLTEKHSQLILEPDVELRLSAPLSGGVPMGR